jgi:hypothetical protein
MKPFYRGVLVTGLQHDLEGIGTAARRRLCYTATRWKAKINRVGSPEGGDQVYQVSSNGSG